MGVIKDIVDIVVPNAQKRIKEGTSSKEALYSELKEIGGGKMNNDNVVLNNISVQEINRQADQAVNIFCEECSYETGLMTFKSAVFKINMQGGYFMYDGEGGTESKCPCCGFDKLVDNM